MIFEYSDKSLGGVFQLTDSILNFTDSLSIGSKLIHILWNQGKNPLNLLINELPIKLENNQLTTVTYLQDLEFTGKNESLVIFSFNREFYCIQDHDQEVSCNGIIFFGAQGSPVITLEKDEVQKFEILYQVFLDEFQTRDTIQGEMLRMLLKRLIIKTTRLAKEQLIGHELLDHQIDTIRKFNILVDQNYRSKKQVKEYADMLFKAPKTLSNLFAKYNQESPLNIIHERVISEAKRLLLLTDKTSKEVAFKLGFEEVASFHKLFKKVALVTPQEFRMQGKMLNKGKINNSKGTIAPHSR